jgi:hypothetical protein
MNQGPLRPGMSAKPINQEAVAVEAIKPKSLAELSGEFGFFTPALWYIKFPFDEQTDLFSLYASDAGKLLHPVTLKSKYAVFTGMGVGIDSDWNYVLYALRLEEWIDFCTWVGTLALSYAPTKLLARVRTQGFTVPDPMISGLVTKDTPTINITVLCMESNQGTFYCEQAQPLGKPSVVFNESKEDDVVGFAANWFEGNSDPYEAK